MFPFPSSSTTLPPWGSTYHSEPRKRFLLLSDKQHKVCSVDHSCLLDKGPVLTLSHLACYPSSSSSCICTRQTAPRARVPTTTTTNCSPVPSLRLRIAIYSSFCSVGKQSRQQVLHCLRHRRANEPPFFSRRTSENSTTAWLDRHAVAVILAFSQSTTSSLLRWRYSQL